MTKLSALSEVIAIADDDLFYVRDASDPGNPDKKAPFSKIRPSGARITHHYRYAGNITIPSLAAGGEAVVSIIIPGAAVGDHVDFNLVPPPPTIYPSWRLGYRPARLSKLGSAIGMRRWHSPPRQFPVLR